jgi:hypothetical protein
MLGTETFANPQKLTYVMYFFPLIPSAYSYFLNRSYFNLVILIVTLIVVALFQAWLSAWDRMGTEKQRDQVVANLINAIGKGGILGLIFLVFFTDFFLYTLAWLLIYILTILRLFNHLDDPFALFIILAQVGLLIFNVSQVLFIKSFMNMKKSMKQK